MTGRLAMAAGHGKGSDKEIVRTKLPRTPDAKVRYFLEHHGFRNVRAAQVFERFCLYQRIGLRIMAADKQNDHRKVYALMEERDAVGAEVRELLRAFPEDLR